MYRSSQDAAREPLRYYLRMNADSKPSRLSDDHADLVVDVFRMLADATRVQLLWCLIGGELRVNDLAERVGKPAPSVSQHLAKLRAEGLVNAHKDGLQVHYTLTNQRCIDLLEHLKGTFCATPGPASRAG